MKVSKVILKSLYHGTPKYTDFQIVDEEISENLKKNEFLYEALFISVDPYLRFATKHHVGKPVEGYQLSRVTKSRNEKYPPGTVLVMGSGWQSGGKSNGKDVWYLRNDIPEQTTKSAGIGILGMVGMTAYHGLTEVCKPKSIETLFISSAAGGVGTAAGQMGKILGCRVLGSCGSDEKIKFCKSIGYDDVINYKAENLEEAMKRVAPNGIDCYFDNVGGVLSNCVLNHMNKNGRIVVCGSISNYNATTQQTDSPVHPAIASKNLIMQDIGYFVFEHLYDEMYQVFKVWVQEGKLKSYETITEGFENLPKAFIEMFEGRNIGKAIVKV